MAKRKPKGGHHAKKKAQTRRKLSARQTTATRSRALKAAITRRKNAEHKRALAERLKRSEAAKRGWITRRANGPRRFADTIRESIKWQRWTYEHRVNVTGTYLYPNEKGRFRSNGEQYVIDTARALFRIVYERYPSAKLYGATILYRRSEDGKTFEEGIVPKYFPWGADKEEVLESFVGQLTNFYNDMSNPDRFQHAYQVRLVGIAARAMINRSSIAYTEGTGEHIPNVISLSRQERRRRQLALT